MPKTYDLENGYMLIEGEIRDYGSPYCGYAALAVLERSDDDKRIAREAAAAISGMASAPYVIEAYDKDSDRYYAIGCAESLQTALRNASNIKAIISSRRDTDIEARNAPDIDWLNITDTATGQPRLISTGL